MMRRHAEHCGGWQRLAGTPLYFAFHDRYDGIGFTKPSLLRQPARGFGNGPAHQEHHGRQQADGHEHPPPAEVGQQEIGDGARQHVADRPKPFHDGDVFATHAGGHEFRNHRLRDGCLTTDADADQKPKEHQCADAPRNSGQQARDAPHHHRGLENHLAAEQVGGGARDQVADELSQERHRGKQARLRRREAEFHDQRTEQECQQRDIDLIDQPRRGNDREYLALVAGHRQALEPTRNVRLRRGFDLRGGSSRRPASHAHIVGHRLLLSLFDLVGFRPARGRDFCYW